MGSAIEAQISSMNYFNGTGQEFLVVCPHPVPPSSLVMCLSPLTPVPQEREVHPRPRCGSCHDCLRDGHETHGYETKAAGNRPRMKATQRESRARRERMKLESLIQGLIWKPIFPLDFQVREPRNLFNPNEVGSLIAFTQESILHITRNFIT